MFLMTPRKIIQHKSLLLDGDGGEGCHYGGVRAAGEGWAGKIERQEGLEYIVKKLGLTRNNVM